LAGASPAKRLGHRFRSCRVLQAISGGEFVARLSCAGCATSITSISAKEGE
jgi:hypothetical protein